MLARSPIMPTCSVPPGLGEPWLAAGAGLGGAVGATVAATAGCVVGLAATSASAAPTAACAPQPTPTAAVRVVGKTVPPNQSAPIDGTPRPGGTLKVVMVGDLVSLDGHQPSPTSAATIHQ